MNPSFIRYPLFRGGDWYYSLDYLDVNCTLQISTVPEIVYKSDYKNLFHSDWSVTLAERKNILLKAVDIFCNADVEIGTQKQSREDFKDLLWEVCGLSYGLVDSWLDIFHKTMVSLIKSSSKEDSNQKRLVVVSMPANTFLTLEECVAVLLDGAFLWLKASSREPISSLRFVASLIKAGWSKNKISLYCFEHNKLSDFLKLADYAILFGGEDIETKYAENEKIKVNGVGRASAIVPAPLNDNYYTEQLLDLVCSNAGRFCKNVSRIFCKSNPEEIGYKLALEMDKIPDLIEKEYDGRFSLTQVGNKSDAVLIEKYIKDRMQKEDVILTKKDLYVNNGQNYIMRPVLIYIKKPNGHPLINTEFSFPFATISSVFEDDLNVLIKNSRFIYRLSEASGMDKPLYEN